MALLEMLSWLQTGTVTAAEEGAPVRRLVHKCRRTIRAQHLPRTCEVALWGWTIVMRRSRDGRAVDDIIAPAVVAPS